MGEEDGKEALNFSALKLEFLQIPGGINSPEHPSTPPFQASAAVPFKWEEQPGKPRPCSDMMISRAAKSLELPPRFSKTPSPTTVLDGPYNVVVGRPKFSSFRFFRDSHIIDSSFPTSPEGTAFDALLAAKKSGGGLKSRGFFTKFKGGKRDFDGGSCRFSPSSVSVSSCDSDDRFAAVKNNCGVKITRNGSFSNINSHAKSSHLWTNIYQGIKQVMQWKSSKKSNKEGRD
ncbi:hypothetical protein C2S51_004317 [Perilla frutescens var. frutescens]|nr:hypothetical protein C2S51_004317 [Perilla frutescens var. frutescens]